MDAILFDATKCTGCERCVTACGEAHGIDPWMAARDRAVVKDGLSAHRLLSIQSAEQGRFVRKSCMHCLEPSCVSACLVGGLTKSPEGPVIYDPDKCIGCRYCMLACPFHVPRYEWDKIVPFVKKCDMCVDRLREGKIPACVEICPEKALEFGDRNELLDIAHSRITKNAGFYQPRVWGEEAYGGTSVLFISDVDLTALGWPGEDTESIPSLTEPLIHKTPFIGLGVMGSLLGVNWIIRRRMQLAPEGAETAEDGASKENTTHGKDEEN